MKSIVFLLISLFLASAFALDERAFYEAFVNEQFEERALLQSKPNVALQDSQLLSTYQYSEINANIFARLSAAAYCSPPTVNNQKKGLTSWTCAACNDSGLKLTSVKAFRIPAAEFYGYIGYNAASNNIVLVFTGSNNIVNWLYNIDAKFIPFDGVPGGEVHQGFYKIWKYTRPTVISLIDEILYAHPSATLVISGHSLGGAIAALATADFETAKAIKLLSNNGIEYASTGSLFDSKDEQLFSSSSTKQLNTAMLYKLGPTYTFGAPRVMNKAASTFFLKAFANSSTQIFRVTHDQDPVVHLPPLLLWPTASHLPTEVYYNGDFSKQVVCGGDDESTKCSNMHPLPVSVSDHLYYMKYAVASDVSKC